MAPRVFSLLLFLTEKKNLTKHFCPCIFTAYFWYYRQFDGPNINFNVQTSFFFICIVISKSEKILGNSNVVVAHPICLTVVFSRHLKRWWCCSSKTSSLKFSSKGKPAALAAILASAAFFLDTNAAPEVAFAIWMRASRAFCNHKKT